MLMQAGQRFVGIGVDALKGQLEIGVLPVEQFWKTSNDEARRQTLAQRLREIEPTLIVLEATDGYETPVTIQLVAIGLRVIVTTPNHVRELAKDNIQTAKSTCLDARTLALFAQIISPQVRPLTGSTKHGAGQIIYTPPPAVGHDYHREKNAWQKR